MDFKNPNLEPFFFPENFQIFQEVYVLKIFSQRYKPDKEDDELPVNWQLLFITLLFATYLRESYKIRHFFGGKAVSVW